MTDGGDFHALWRHLLAKANAESQEKAERIVFGEALEIRLPFTHCETTAENIIIGFGESDPQPDTVVADTHAKVGMAGGSIFINNRRVHPADPQPDAIVEEPRA